MQRTHLFVSVYEIDEHHGHKLLYMPIGHSYMHVNTSYVVINPNSCIWFDRICPHISFSKTTQGLP